MTIRLTMLFLSLALAASSPAGPQGLIILETFEVPNEVWHKTPGKLRNDGAGLRARLVDLSKRGTVKRIDATGSLCVEGKKNLTKAVQFMIYPTEFHAPGDHLIPSALEAAEPGSSCEMEPNVRGDLRVAYSLGPLHPELMPTLVKGSGQNTDRSSLPAMADYRLSTGFTIPRGGIQLVGYGPPTPFERASSATWVTFAVTAPGSTYTNEEDHPAKNQFTEIVIVKGPVKAPEAEATVLLGKLLAAAKPDATLGVAGRSNQRVSLESVTYRIYPTEAFESGTDMAVPTALETRNVGDSLMVECSPETDGKMSLRVVLEHDFREPELPEVPGRGGALIDKETKLFQLGVQTLSQVTPNEWALLTTVPLAPILSGAAKESSAYIFARVTTP